MFQFNKVLTSKIEEVSVQLNIKSDNSLSFAEIRKCFMIMVRSSAIGAFIGMMPGLGSAVACFVAYGEEKRRSKIKNCGELELLKGLLLLSQLIMLFLDQQ